jgi:adenylate kinase
MNLVILGPPGSGKGTQAKLLVEKMGLFYFEMGGLLRAKAEENSPLGRQIASLINGGKLVPDEIIGKILVSSLTESNLKRGILFDGFPRILSQVQILEKELTKRGAQVDKAILIDISYQESLRRLTSRRTCPKCGQIYNLATLPPKEDELCDNCKIKLTSREDETPEVTKQRLEIYRKETLPVVDYYRESGKLIEVDGERPVGVIFEDILGRLK